MTGGSTEGSLIANDEIRNWNAEEMDPAESVIENAESVRTGGRGSAAKKTVCRKSHPRR